MVNPVTSSLLIIGLNHRTAPVALREEAAFAAEQLPQTLASLTEYADLAGAVVVSTCNRTELYCDTDLAKRDKVTEWLIADRQLSDSAADSLYLFEGTAAIRHTFEVACGLDSMVLGEPQILGQVKQAYAVSRENGFAGPLLNLLFQQAFAIAKQVRSSTMIGASPVSVASAAVALARQIFSGFEKHTALLVGAGETVELTARHLHAHGLSRMIIANRHVERARGLALQFGAYAISLGEIATHIGEADMVITSTASRDPIIAADSIGAALIQRRHRPMFIVDLAVPRDVEAAVAQFEDVYLYTIDDLNEVIVRNQQNREQAAGDARTIIEDAAKAFERTIASRDTVPLIRSLRSSAKFLRQQTVEEARRMLAAGQDPESVLDQLARTLTARILHRPTARLREAGEQADILLAQAAAELFGLNETNKDDEQD